MADDQSKNTYTKPKKKKSFLGKLIKLCLVLIILLLIVVAFLPTVISMGVGQGLVKNIISDQINGTADFDSLKVSWFGSQTIEHLTIKNEQGDTTGDVTINLDRGLLALVFGSSDFGTLTLDGELKGVRYADGTTSFEKIIKEPDPNAPPLDLSKYKVHLDVNTLHITLDDQVTNKTFIVRDAIADINFNPTGSTLIDFKATTEADGKTGNITLAGTADNVMKDGGALNIDNASFDLAGQLTSVPMNLVDALAGLGNKLAAITGPELSTASLKLVGTLQNADAEIAADATNLDMNGNAVIADGELKISAEKPLTINTKLDNETLQALLLDSPQSDNFELQPLAGQQPMMSFNVNNLAVKLPEGGGLNLNNASLDTTLTLSNAQLIVKNNADVQSVDLPSFTANVRSDNLSDTLAIVADGNAVVNNTQTSTITADITHDSPLDADGAIAFDPTKVTGEVRGSDLPTSLLQGMLAETPIFVSRDIGPSLNLVATFSSGADRAITAAINAANLTGTLDATVGADGAIVGRTANLETTLHPELVRGYVPGGGISLPSLARVNLTSFAIPAREDGEAFSLQTLQLAGSAALQGNIITIAPADNAASNSPPIALSQATLNFESPALGERITLDGGIVANDASVTIDETITNLFAADGILSPLAAIPVGTIAINNITPQQMAKFAPDSAALISNTLAGPLTMNITTAGDADALTADITIDSPGVNGEFHATRDAQAIVLERGRLNTRLTPELSRALQAESELPIELSADRASLVINSPMTLATVNDEGSIVMQLESLQAAIEATPITVRNAPGFENAIILSDLNSTVAATLGDAASYALDGSANVQGSDGNTSISTAEFDVALQRDAADAAFTPDANITLNAINLDALAAAMSADGQSFATLLGDRGNLVLTATPTSDGFTAKAQPAFPNLAGTLNFSKNTEFVEVTGDIEQFTLAAKSLEDYLNTPKEGMPPTKSPMSVNTDVPVEIAINKIKFPAAILEGGKIDSTAITIDALIAMPGQFEITRQHPTTKVAENLRVKDWKIAVKGSDLRDGITANITGILRLFSGEQRTRGTVDLNAIVANLLDNESKFSLDSKRLTIDGTIDNVPTWAADVFAGQDGFLVAALGDAINATIRAENFSADGGTLTADASTSNGSSLNARLRGNDSGYQTVGDPHIDGALALTEALRNRVLQKLHPIFADIAAVDEQLKIKVTDAYFPAGDDKSRINADIAITLGEVEMKPSSPFLRLLKLAEATDEETIPGFIGHLDGRPTIVKIRNGIVKYDDFILHVGRKDSGYRHRLVFTGLIDLPQNYVRSLTASYPVADLAGSVDEIRGIPNVANVGVKFSGPLATETQPAQLKREIDIQINAEDLIKEGLREGLGGGKKGGGLLDGLLGGDDDDKKTKDDKRDQD